MEVLCNNQSRWGLVSKLFHWISAIIVIGLLYVGLTMKDMAPSDAKWQLYDLHKSFGILILTLTGLRILWRAMQRTPEFLYVPGFFKIFSKLSTPILYLSLFTMIFSGILMSNAGGYPIKVFNLFVFPALIEKDPTIGSWAKMTHTYMGWLLIIMIAGHTLAALYHHFVLKDTLLKRMLFGKVN